MTDTASSDMPNIRHDAWPEQGPDGGDMTDTASHQPTMTRFTVSDYHGLSDRVALDKWLIDEGLGRFVVALIFTGEGPSVVERYDEPLRTFYGDVPTVCESVTFKRLPPIQWDIDRWVSA